MKKVLIALDYEPSAEKIAEEGYALAKNLNAETILLHVVAEVIYYTSPNYSSIMGYDGFNSLDMINVVNTDELKTAAGNYLNKSKQHLGDDSIQTVIKEGDFAASILDTAREMNIDIIVMGSHGRRGLDKMLLGSVAEQVLHKTGIPMFIIPTRNIEEK